MIKYYLIQNQIYIYIYEYHMNITEKDIHIPLEYYLLLIPVGYIGVCIGFIRYKTRQYIDKI